MKSDPLEDLRRICMALPEAVEKMAWGEPTFRVKKKIFAMYASASNHHGAGRDAVWVKAPLGVQETLVRSEPTVYFVPPYVGVSGWIGIYLAEVEPEILRAHVGGSYCLVAPKRLALRVDA